MLSARPYQHKSPRASIKQRAATQDPHKPRRPSTRRWPVPRPFVLAPRLPPPFVAARSATARGPRQQATSSASHEPRLWTRRLPLGKSQRNARSRRWPIAVAPRALRLAAVAPRAASPSAGASDARTPSTKRLGRHPRCRCITQPAGGCLGPPRARRPLDGTFWGVSKPLPLLAVHGRGWPAADVR